MAKPAEIKKRARQLAKDGKILDAIRALEGLVQGDSTDPYDLVMMGDLCIRGGRAGEATSHYERAVTAYRNASLHRNGIALCRKVLRVNPGQSSFLLLLAELCEREGLVLDAVSAYLEYAETQDQLEQTGEPLEWLDRLGRLKPRNSEMLTRQAECLVRWERVPVAVALLLSGAESADSEADRNVLLEMADQMRQLHSGGDEELDSETSSYVNGAFTEEPSPDGPAPLADPDLEPDRRSETVAGAGDAQAGDDAALEYGAIDPESLESDREGSIDPSMDGALSDGASMQMASPLTSDADGSDDPSVASSHRTEPADDARVIELDATGVDAHDPRALDMGADEPGEHLYDLDAALSEDDSPPSAELEWKPTLGEVSPEVAESLELTETPMPEPRPRSMMATASDLTEVRARAELPDAADTLEALSSADPVRLDVLEKLLELHIREGDILSAQDLRERMARALVHHGRPEDALSQLEAYLEIEPSAGRIRDQYDRLAAEIGGPAAPAAEAGSGDEPAPVSSKKPESLFDVRGVSNVQVRDDAPTVSEDDMVDLGALLNEFRDGLKASMADASPKDHYDLGLSHVEMGLYEEAAEAFEQACTDPELEAESRELWGRCLREVGRFEEAARVLRAALALRPESLGVRYQLALSLEGAGEADDAMRLFESILREDPNFEDTGERVAALGGSDCAKPGRASA